MTDERLRALLQGISAGPAEGLTADVADPAVIARLLAGIDERIAVITGGGFGGLHAPVLRRLAEARDRLAERLVAQGEGGGRCRDAVAVRLGEIDARISALAAEGFSEGNIARMAQLIRERAVLVDRQERSDPPG